MHYEIDGKVIKAAIRIDLANDSLLSLADRPERAAEIEADLDKARELLDGVDAMDYHTDVMHAAVEAFLSEVRSKWEGLQRE